MNVQSLVNRWTESASEDYIQLLVKEKEAIFVVEQIELVTFKHLTVGKQKNRTSHSQTDRCGWEYLE